MRAGLVLLLPLLAGAQQVDLERYAAAQSASEPETNGMTVEISHEDQQQALRSTRGLEHHSLLTQGARAVAEELARDHRQLDNGRGGAALSFDCGVGCSLHGVSLEVPEQVQSKESGSRDPKGGRREFHLSGSPDIAGEYHYSLSLTRRGDLLNWTDEPERCSGSFTLGDRGTRFRVWLSPGCRARLENLP